MCIPHESTINMVTDMPRSDTAHIMVPAEMTPRAKEYDSSARGSVRVSRIETKLIVSESYKQSAKKDADAQTTIEGQA